MRNTFFKTLYNLMETDPDIYLVVGDIGFSFIEPIRDRFPERFINPGVAEQNMTGVCAGLALCGKKVFMYSIGNFPTLRCIEQIRNDICYHNLPVKIVCAGGGFSYGALGFTHHATEDIAILRALPGMQVIAPCDIIETGEATLAAAGSGGPCYLRLERTEGLVIHQVKPAFRIGRAILISEGKDLTIISTGSTVSIAAQVAEELGKKGIGARLLSMHTIKPVDVPAITSAAADTDAIITIEEHSLIGGLGSAVAEALARENIQAPLKCFGLPPEFQSVIGDRDFLLKHYGLSADNLLQKIMEYYNSL